MRPPTVERKSSVSARARTARSSLERLGSRLGLIEPAKTEARTHQPETGSTDNSETAPAENHPHGSGVGPGPELGDPAGAAGALLRLDAHLRQSESQSAPEEPARRFTALSHKKVALAGFDSSWEGSLARALESQQAVPVRLADLEQPGNDAASWDSCDVVICQAPSNWAVTEPIDAAALSRIDKPMVVVGPRDVLMRASKVIRSAMVDFVPSPASEEDTIWRAALLLTRQPASPTRASRPPGRTKTEVVIAEDDTTTRALVSAMLSRHGMVCHLADNGGTALELVRTMRPDAAVLDVNMPCMDGFQVLAFIKQDPSLASVEVVLLTSRQAEADILLGFGLGADDYVTKPFSPMELAARIKRLVANRP